MVLSTLAPLLFASSVAIAPPPRPVDEDMAMGSPSAPVTVIEYSAPTCPPCTRFHVESFAQFKARWIDTGKVRYVLREAPVHPNLDPVAFLVARCAGEGRYFKVVDDVMRAQPEYLDETQVSEVLRKFDVVLLREMQAIGMSEAEAQACIGDAKAVQAMNARVLRETKQYAVDKAPTFVVGGVKLAAQAGKPIDPAVLDAAIQSALARAAAGPRLRR